MIYHSRLEGFIKSVEKLTISETNGTQFKPHCMDNVFQALGAAMKEAYND